MQQHLLNHFCTSGDCGFLDAVSLIFRIKTDLSDSLNGAEYWRSTLKTMVPFEFDMKDSVQHVYKQYFEHLYFYRTGIF